MCRQALACVRLPASGIWHLQVYVPSTVPLVAASAVTALVWGPQSQDSTRNLKR